jgi:hypothetical protein
MAKGAFTIRKDDNEWIGCNHSSIKTAHPSAGSFYIQHSIYGNPLIITHGMNHALDKMRPPLSVSGSVNSAKLLHS